MSQARGRVPPLLGFLSQVQHALRAADLDAGCGEVLPRAAFTARLPVILSRAAAPEEQRG